MKMKTLVGAVLVAVSLGFAPVLSAATYWRWTSNATADEPIWTEETAATLSVPAFTGATAEDNVLELLDDCSVAEILYFTKSCTICSKADLASAATVTLAKNCYCVCQADEIKTKDVVFTGAADWKNPSDAKSYAVNNDATAGNCAWAIYKSWGGAKLVLGAGTVIRDFRIDSTPTGIANYRGAVILPSENGSFQSLNSKTPALEVCADAQIINVRGLGPAVSVANKLGNATIRMTGGEIAGCFNGINNEGYRGTVCLVSGSFCLSGGAIHDNYANNALDRNKKAASGVFSKDAGVYLSGNPAIRDNGTQSANGGDYLPHNLQTEGSGRIHLAGDLTESAYVGCSQNVGEGNPFGVADGNYAGAEFIRADGNDALVGQCAGQELRWARGGTVDIATCRVSVETLVYTGSVQSPLLTVEDFAVGGATLEEGVDYSISGDTSGKEVGNYYLVLNGLGDYTGTKVVGWQIVEAGGGDDPTPIDPPLVDNTLRFLDSTRLMYFVAGRDYDVDGILFGNSTRTKISGGHAITVNAGNLKLLDEYKRIFLGDCELTLSGAGTRLTINSTGATRQSGGLRLVAEDGAKFENPNWDFGDNGNYFYTARGVGSEVQLGLSANPSPVDNYGFEAYSGGLVALTGRYFLELGGISHTYIAEGGTLNLPAVGIKGGTSLIRIVGSGTVTLGTANVDGGTVTLKLDSSWDDSTAHLMVAGDLSLGANVRYAVDLAGFPGLEQVDRIAFARAGGTVSLVAPKAGIDVIGGDGRRIELEADGDFVYLKLTNASEQQGGGWRWTSNARDTSPSWHQEDGDTLYLPNFTSEWTQDNVIEFSGDCRVTEPLVFSGRLTMRSRPDTGVHTVRFAKSAARLVCDGTVVVSNLVFQGDIVWAETGLSLAGRFGLEPASAVSDDYAHTAWRVNAGRFLTLGPGATVKNFLTRYADGGGAVYNAGGVLNILPGAVVCDNRGNCGAVVNEGEDGVVNVFGGEFVRNYVAELANSRLASGSALMAFGDGGRLNLHGGCFRDNFTRSDSHGGAIGLNARDGTKGVFLSGSAVVRDNYNVTLAEDGTVESSTLMNLYVRDARKLAMDGDLAPEATVGVWRGQPGDDDAPEDAVPRLKFGVCSDLHLNTAYRGATHFERALGWWKREGVDAIVIAGDIADCGDVDSCRMVTNSLTRIFGDDWPKLMVILGNHDSLGDSSVRRDVLRNVFRMGDETDEKAFFTKVKGYSFVGRSWPRESFSMAAFLESHAADLKGPKPFVFVQHPHPTGTCHGPYVWGQESETAGMEQAADFLKAYPNAIAFSGHSHYQICDERTVWKGDFISVGTGSMANQETLRGRENSTYGSFNPVMPAAEACGYCAEMVTLYDHEMRIQRHEFETSAEGDPIGDDWLVPLGEAGEWTFERRAADSLPPAFLRGAEVAVRSYAGTMRDKSSGGHEIWEVAFPTAPAHDGRPRAVDYEVTAVVNIYDCEWRAVKRVLSPHYGRTADIDTSATCLFAADVELPTSGQFVTFEVRPISPFGKAGKPIFSPRFYR